MSVPDGYEAVIGLEIHVQLSTRTKMFCGCALSFGDAPNVHTCPVCLAHPGVLPVVNEQAVNYALKIGAAFGCEFPPSSIFHRKNYFYPDNPKAYQISQYDFPIAGPGRLGDVRIHHAHLEEDAAKNIHVGSSGRIHGSGETLVDFNRAGTPLVEIVTEPDIRSASQAREWAQLLRTTVQQLGVSNVNMEEGSLRVDANVSVRPKGEEKLGTKTELKNMNSFRFLERGIEAELARQRELIRGGGTVAQETLHFDPGTGALTPLRSKEESHDYRYFPEPDLVSLAPTEEMLKEAQESLPELPIQRADRYENELGLSSATATLLVGDPELAAYFEQVAEASAGEPKVAANWVTGELAAARRGVDGGEAVEVTPAALAELIDLVQQKTISHAGGKTVLERLVAEGGSPADIVESEGLAQISDTSELDGIVDSAIEADPAAAQQIRDGEQKGIGGLVGAVMRETKGRADGGEVTRLIRQKLGL